MVSLNLPTLEIAWVVKIIASTGECEVESMLLSIAEKNVKNCATTCLVSFKKHKVMTWEAAQFRFCSGIGFRKLGFRK